MIQLKKKNVIADFSSFRCDMFLTITMFLVFVVLMFTQQIFAQNIRIDKYKGQPQTISKLRVASASILPDKWQKERNWQRIEKMVRKAVSEGGSRVVVTPEGVLDGYVINEVNAVKEPQQKQEILKRFFDLAEPIDGPFIKKACELADELDIFLVMGFLERRDELLYNTAILIDIDGDIIGRYSKTHFAQGYSKNPEFYCAGNEYPVFDTPFGKVGILICYDRQLPEPARILAVKGAQVLFVPSYGSYTDDNGWNTALMRTRAYENALPVIFCNPYQSLLITDRGEIKAVGTAGEIVYYDIKTSPQRYTKRFENRRPATYGALVNDEDPAKKK